MNKNVLMGIRFDEPFAKKFRNFCKSHHLLMSSFVAEIVKNKIVEIQEDEEDIATYEANLNEPTISHEEMKKILKKRGVDV